LLKLMIVDDEAIILQGLQHMVRRADTLFTEVTGVTDSVEALRLMDTLRPDLVITDIQMPEMNGLELIREAQRKQVKRFVILTGYDVFEYAQQAVRLGAVDYLLKPIDPKELASLLVRLSLEIVEEQKHLQPDAPAEEPEGYDHNENIRTFKDLIHNHFMRDLSLEEVAGHLSLHPNYVSKLIKQETGMTFVQYLRTVRMDKAKSLLSAAQDLPMEQIARNVGFDNPRHFYKVFKQHVGVTPGSYRSSAIAEQLQAGTSPSEGEPAGGAGPIHRWLQSQAE
jgi:two-component system, response regulator YesN